MLRDKASARGALVRHGVSVIDMQVDAESASVQTSYGTERARFIVDASGQDCFVAKLRQATVPYSQFGKAAAFAHFSGLSDEALEVIGPGSDIRIMMVEGGWLWVIHLPVAGSAWAWCRRSQGSPATFSNAKSRCLRCCVASRTVPRPRRPSSPAASATATMPRAGRATPASETRLASSTRCFLPG